MTTVPVPASPTTRRTCVYDAWNRLTEVRNGATVIAQYRYDGLNRRTRKFQPEYGGTWTVTEYYYNAAWQLLEVHRQGGLSRSGEPLSEPSLATGLLEQYVWSARYVDAPILRDRNDVGGGDLGKSGSGLDERVYYVSDANMNVTALIDGTPGSQTLGEAVERYHYDPYGKVTFLEGSTGGQTEWNVRASQASTVANEVLFAGYRRDDETGLYHVRNRPYHPLLGRWLTRDPLGYVDGMSLYEYCSGAPVAALDPSGLGIGFSDPSPFDAIRRALRDKLDPVREAVDQAVGQRDDGFQHVRLVSGPQAKEDAEKQALQPEAIAQKVTTTVLDAVTGQLDGAADALGLLQRLADGSITPTEASRRLVSDALQKHGVPKNFANAVLSGDVNRIKEAWKKLSPQQKLAVAAVVVAAATITNAISDDGPRGSGTGGEAPDALDPDIAKKIKQFEGKPLREQKSTYENQKKTYQKHLEEYGQQPGKTTGETNRMERELKEMKRILHERGQDVE